jgi:DNA-binding Xre family transcriptional regulator
MGITWNLRMVAAQHDIWTGAALRRAMSERAGYRLSSASVSELMHGTPRQVKVATLAALCVTLDCQPGDLLVADGRPDDTPHADDRNDHDDGDDGAPATAP